MNSQNLYDILGVSPKASEKEIKLAYRRLALQLHPDKCKDEDAKEKFQKLQEVYKVLCNPVLRQRYDRTGDAEDIDVDEVTEWTEFFKSFTKDLDQSSIETFFKQYVGSKEERKELIDLYQKFEGDMTQVLQWQISADEDEDPFRFKAILEAAIDAKEIEEYAKFSDWAQTIKPSLKKKRNRTKKNREPSLDLIASIGNRQARRRDEGSIISDLINKYGGEEQFYEEPSEAEFLKTQKRLKKGKK